LRLTILNCNSRWFIESVNDGSSICRQCENIQYEIKKFGSYFSTLRYNTNITFHVGTLSRLGFLQNLSRHARGRGAGGHISVNTRLACCEKRRNDVYLPSLLYAVTLSRVLRAERSRSGRSVSRMDTRVHSPRHGAR